ncbi:MAG: RHS repeat protein, partial [Verrucomicrobiae bacterium]|nr:RHS repeat protein [Verrucomicrobiae bacterium]
VLKSNQNSDFESDFIELQNTPTRKPANYHSSEKRSTPLQFLEFFRETFSRLEQKRAIQSRYLRFLACFFVISNSVKSAAFSYDSLNRLKSATYPSGLEVVYSWDDASNLTRVTYNLTGPGSDSDNDGLSDAWEIFYGFNPNDPSDATQDADGDGMSNRDEYYAGTDPKDAASVLKIDSFYVTVEPSGTVIRLAWDASPGQSFRVEESGDLKTWTIYAEGIQANTYDNWLDVGSAEVKRFYRIVLEGSDDLVPAKVVSAATEGGVPTATVEFSWPSVAGVNYVLERSFDLEHWYYLSNGVPATAPRNFYKCATVGTKAFYRVRLATKEDAPIDFGGGRP